MDALDTYQSDAVERPLIRRRLFWALVISLILHIGIILWFRETHLGQFNVPVERLVPRIFNVRTITIDEAALNGQDKDDASKKPDLKPNIKPLQLPDEKPVVDASAGKFTPMAPAPVVQVKPIASDRPTVESTENQAITRAQTDAQQQMLQDLNAMKESLLKDQPPNVKNSLIRLPDSVGSNAEGLDKEGMQAASSRLDTLIGHGLHKGDAPVTLPGGALFEFDSSALRPASVDQLRKLGELIRRNPAVTFSIDGYTDSFGDTAYNEQLSQQRADAVRSWLVQNMDVDPSHIQARGYGATNFLVMPQAVDLHSQPSIDREKLLERSNRRVEIRFKFPSAQ